VSAPRPEGDSSPDDSASAALLADDWLLVGCSADSPLADCSGPDLPQAYSDASDFPEFPERLPVEERLPADDQWSLSPVFPQGLLSPPDVPQRLLDASRQLHASAKAVPDALPSPVASAQTKPAREVAFSLPLPAGLPLLRAVPLRDLQPKLSRPEQPGV
jgi:hypothetical protein